MTSFNPSPSSIAELLPPVSANRPAMWRNAVLIGTPDSAAAVASQFALLEGHPGPAACLLTEKTAEPSILSVPIRGTIDDLARLHERTPFSLAIVSLPAAYASTTLRLRCLLRDRGIAERFIPCFEDLLAGAAAPIAFGSPALDMTELIGRTPYGIDRRSVAGILEGKRILITGAGGSIGSEICRIAATFKPAQIILMERSENALFEIDRQIAARFPAVARKALLHDVTDAEATLRHVLALRPDVVFHAAAHKHVPLMEDHPGQAVTNNLFGTRSIADAALAARASRFVMISSDKAVNPTSIMGATKRLAEMYVQSLHRRHRGDASAPTSFSMVRFGNVLGSACSVLPIWSRQLGEGGPITVTDPRMTRYFMTINEAATLVIQSAVIDTRQTAAASVYVLDMGEPVRILDLATRFVRLSGFEPVTERGGEPQHPGASERPRMAIAITGARPGEKLYEELAYADEALAHTPYPGIRAWKGELPNDYDEHAMVADLSTARQASNRADVVDIIRRYVPEMHLGN